MQSLTSASDSSTVNRLSDRKTTVLFAVGTPAHSQIIFIFTDEQSWHFMDHVRLVIIAIHKFSSIITILRTCFRWDDAFELSSVTVEGDQHKIIFAEIANSIHLAQFQLLKAVQSVFSITFTFHDDTKKLHVFKIPSRVFELVAIERTYERTPNFRPW